MTAPAATRGDTTKARLLAAGEHLFARKGIDGVTLRELHELAGQKNPSALHYHFGSRRALVLAILAAQQEDVDAATEAALNESMVGAGSSVEEVLGSVVPSVAAKLETPSGQDFLRIVPQLLPELSRSLRHGRLVPTTQTTVRVMTLLERSLGDFPESVRRERLVTYILVLTTLLAERALALAEEQPLELDHPAFVDHLIAVLTGALTAPSPSPRT